MFASYATPALLISLWANTISAQQTINGGVGTGSQCPDGWSFAQLGDSGTTYCCPGQNQIIDDNGYCFIGGSSVPFTEAGYTSIVSSLAAEESGGVMMASTTISSSVDATATASSGMETSAAMTGSSSGASGAAATSSSSEAGAAPTGLVANGVLGAIGGAMLYML